MTEYGPHLLGQSGEEVALRYLRSKKYKIVEKGFRMFRGEIDIIAYDKKTLVFIEVKTRTKSDFGRPEESVNPSKQQQIRKIAQGYLDLSQIRDTACRFDVIALTKTDQDEYTLHHIKNAF